MPFIDHELLPGVHHIEDGLGVCFTLIVGQRQALLVDSGYGLEDVSAYVKRLTPLPVTLWLTHAHHDHMLGARWFDSARLHPADLPGYATYSGSPWTDRILERAESEGLAAEARAWRNMPMPTPVCLEGETIDLGGLTAQVISCPGHTPGSMVVYVPELKLLLTGDDWNPCTWLFFEEALSIQAYRKNMLELLHLPFEWVVCSHNTGLHPRARLEAFLAGLTDAAIEAAPESEVGEPYGIRTRQLALPGDQVMVFDGEKANFQRQS